MGAGAPRRHPGRTPRRQRQRQRQRRTDRTTYRHRPPCAQDAPGSAWTGSTVSHGGRGHGRIATSDRTAPRKIKIVCIGNVDSGVKALWNKENRAARRRQHGLPRDAAATAEQATAEQAITKGNNPVTINHWRRERGGRKCSASRGFPTNRQPTMKQRL